MAARSRSRWMPSSRLLDYSWPGNVRELRNVIRTILAICDSDVIRMVDLPARPVAAAVTIAEARRRPVERDAIRQANIDPMYS